MPISPRSAYSRLHWPTVAVESSPKPVRTAWQAHEGAADKALLSLRASTDATAAVHRVPTEDRDATIAAIDAGRPVPESTLAAKQAAAEEADRIAAAQTSIALRAEHALVAAAREHRSEWFAGIAPDLEAAVERATETLSIAEAALTEAAGLAAVYRWLESGHLDRAPSTVVPDDARAAIASGREALRTLTPRGIADSIREKAIKDADWAAELANDFGGVQRRSR